MKKLQNFFDSKKTEHKFKQAGTGHRLDEQRQMPVATNRQPSAAPRVAPAASAQRAGEAALARLQPDRPLSASARSARAKALAEIKAEKAAAGQISQASASKTFPPEQPSFHDDQAPVSVSGIFFECPLECSSVFPRSSVDEHLQECLLTRLLPEKPIEASAKMIHTLNKDKEKRLAGIEIMCKYIDNVCNNPTEEKYHKIRVGNKAYTEKVASLEGSHEFLQAVGFFPRMLPHQDQEENFLVMSPDAITNIERLRSSCDILRSTEPVKATLHRGVKVYQASTHATRFQLPQDFYRITSEEVKREQQHRTEEIERNSQLRTKATREAEIQKNLRRYRYALIRVRFPDGILLQGTFHATEKLSALFEFTRNMLVNDWQPFVLTDATGRKFSEENCSLAELRLAPAAVVNFSWDAAIMAEITAAQGTVQQKEFLKPELMSSIQTL
ncbi:UBX domain-containing protein 6-like [Asterias rubens]|uniref:UBX domain-containing protein 6-like n=1 Tax=Asterias rubens TaxID=7604 RepID=UPI001455CF46|nr:UBX domain-containing protein 6-like [Asterias rubens]